MTLFQVSKRVVDFILSGLLLIVLAPLLLLTALVLLITEKRPLFYNSRRYVSEDKPITLYKFRTMYRDAKSDKYRLTERFMRGGYLDIPLTCEVFTPIGRLIERTQLVEVPQLLNVLAGQMSLIGNRPLPHDNIQLLKNLEGWKKRFDSPAGISGIAQIVGKLSLKPRERLALEAVYSEVYQKGNILKCDCMILLYTLRVIALGKAMPLTRAHGLLRACLPHAARNADLSVESYNEESVAR